MPKLTSEKIQENLGKLANITNRVCSSELDCNAIYEKLRAKGYNNLTNNEKRAWDECSC
jgi:adenine-specific DNA methylase